MTAQLIEGGRQQDQLLDSLNNRFYGYYWGQAFCYQKTGRWCSSTWGCREKRQEICMKEEKKIINSWLQAYVCLPLVAVFLLLFMFFCCIASCIHTAVQCLDTLIRLLWGRWADKHVGFCRFSCVTASGRLAPSFLVLSWAPGRCVPGHTSAASSVVPAVVTWLHTAASFWMACEWEELLQLIIGGMNKSNNVDFITSLVRGYLINSVCCTASQVS